MSRRFEFDSIGTIHSCFKEKFGIPRQPGLVADATATLELLPPYNRPEVVKGLEGFSHLWLTFVFHAIEQGKWSPTVRPPRLGGNKRVGVFASRSTHRPNPIGLSVVELERVESDAQSVVLHLKGVDLLDGTPVLDIKPYLPYVDAIEQAEGGYASSAPGGRQPVGFSAEAERVLQQHMSDYPRLRILITELLALDPRPAYKQTSESDRIYGMRLLDFDINWRMDTGGILVTQVTKL